MSDEIKKNVSETDLEKVSGGKKGSIGKKGGIGKNDINIVGTAIASSGDDRRGWDDHVYDHEGP